MISKWIIRVELKVVEKATVGVNATGQVNAVELLDIFPRSV